MKFFIENKNENIVNLIRKAGYFSLGQKDSEMSFIRPLERSGYPRFHLYISTQKDELVFNLHLDQKRPVYKGTSAHSGEYEGTIIENEAQRIKQVLL